MSVSAHVFTKFGLALASKKVDLTSDTLKVALLTAYTPGQDTHEFVSDVLGAGTEVSTSGTGYTRQALGSVTFTESGHVYTLTCANPSWAASTITAAFAVFYDDTPGTDATRPVICYWDFGGNVSDSSGTFTLTISGSGLATITGS